MTENRWIESEAAEIAAAAGESEADRALALQIHASRLIGSDPDLVLHGGGNTSVKVTRPDLFGMEREVMHVKGSGHDLATITREGMPGLWLEPVRALRRLERLADEDMVNALRGAMLDASGPYPSIESLLHAFLPHRFINHTHATAMIALADLPEARAVIREIFGERIGVVPFFMPGFELGRAAAEIFDENPEVEGLILLKHGHFAFGESAREAYGRLIAQTNAVEEWFAANRRPAPRRPAAAEPRALGDVLPALRGAVGAITAEHEGDRDAPMPVIDLRRSDEISAFLSRADLEDLARAGVATPDHVIRTKNTPVLLEPGADIAAAVQDYARRYRAYFERNAARTPEGRRLLNPAPNVAWIPGLGIAGIGQDARAAAAAADLAGQNIRAMAMAQDAGGYRPVDEAQLFDMEYWALEQAKLGRARPEFAGRVVLITGGAGAIGLATAEAFAARGASVFLVDLSQEALDKALGTLGPHHGGIALDITTNGAGERAVAAAVARFGGLDILISNAGAAWTGEIANLDDALLRRSFELNFFAHLAFAQASVAVLRAQGRGGQLLFNVSKQAVNPGRNFGAYGLPKATTFFLVKQLALELGAEGIRANGINADRIRSGLLDDAFIAQRARARGIDEETYMAGNLLKREVEARHVAEGFVALARAERTTAHVLTVDGGNIEASLR